MEIAADHIQVELKALLPELAQAILNSEWDRAMGLGQRFAGADAASPGLVLEMAAVLADAELIDAAEAWLLHGDRTWPGDVWMFERYCRLAGARRPFEVAAARWRELIARHPDSPIGATGLAGLYRQSGNESEAAALYADTAKAFPGDVWAAHGDALTPSFARDWAEAVRRWSSVCERFADHDHGWFQLAQALMEADRLDEAAAVAQQGLTAFPGYGAMAGLLAEIEDRAAGRTVAAFVRQVFQDLRHREPEPEEAAQWVRRIEGGLPEREFYRQMTLTYDYVTWNQVRPGHPPGHYYSPVIDPGVAVADWRKSMQSTPADMDGITLDIAAMERLWQQNVGFMQSMRFAEHKGGGTRYYWENGLFPVRDALILAAMINHARPKRIVEVGSGFSSGVILDAIEKAGLRDCRLTCIDPYVDPSNSFFREEDAQTATVVAARVQDAPLDVFDRLEAGDILFIDSTHVVKTGSDVHYEIFNVLPRLRAGVLIHFHDIDFPFEYNERWIFESRWSWNEAYILRAFLAYNEDFKIVFFNDLFFKLNVPVAEAAFPGVFPSWKWTAPGGSIWIAKS